MGRRRWTGGRWPKVEILGVHAVPRYPEVHLVEMIVRAPRWRVDCEEIKQGPTRGEDLGGIDVQYLSGDGTRVIDDDSRRRNGRQLCSDSEPDESATRLMFLLYHARLDQPLRTPGGKKLLPAPTPMPERLMRLLVCEF